MTLLLNLIIAVKRKNGISRLVTTSTIDEQKQMADEYWNIDITDVDSIVKKCAEERVDGVLAYSINQYLKPLRRMT